MLIKNYDTRIFDAIKLITAAAKAKEGKIFKNLREEFIQTADLNSDTIKSAITFQEEAWSKKHLLKNYRWR